MNHKIKPCSESRLTQFVERNRRTGNSGVVGQKIRPKVPFTTKGGPKCDSLDDLQAVQKSADRAFYDPPSHFPDRRGYELLLSLLSFHCLTTACRLTGWLLSLHLRIRHQLTIF